MTIDTESIRDAAEVLDVLTSNLRPDHPIRVEYASRAKTCVAALYSAADAIDAQAAEIERLRDALECLIIGACAVGVPHMAERLVLQGAVDEARAALKETSHD